MVQINYNQDRDELELIFKKCEIPYCKKLDGGIIFEFTEEDDLSAIILPNFFKLIQRPPNPGANFSLGDAKINDNTLILVIQMNDQSITVKIDLTKLDK